MAATNNLFLLAFFSTCLTLASCHEYATSSAILSLAVIFFIISVVMFVVCIGMCVFLVWITPRMVKQKNPTLAEMDEKKQKELVIKNPIADADDDEIKKKPL